MGGVQSGSSFFSIGFAALPERLWLWTGNAERQSILQAFGYAVFFRAS